MSPSLKKAIDVETTFDMYTLTELIGEGGAGRVYGGHSSDGASVALKVLAADRASSDKRRRFKNEIAFLAKTTHPNIVSVIDHGVVHGERLDGAFYVMPRYDGSLRDVMKSGDSLEHAMKLFSWALDGVEAAHLMGVVHRDLKPENLLCHRGASSLAVADFGIARFTQDLLSTAVETTSTQRMANFVYAAPEQRIPGRTCSETADIYALGLMLNELFTGAVPQGTEYQLIASASPLHSYLDGIVASMLRQSPEDRPQSIRELKGLMQRHAAEAVTLQRLSTIDSTVIPEGQIDDPLAFEPPKLVGFDWDGGMLTLTLDRPVSSEWLMALRNMGSYSSLHGKGPEVWGFRGAEAFVDARDGQVQALIDNFKNWLPIATGVHHANLEATARSEDTERRRRLAEAKALEERRLAILRDVKI